MRMRTPGWPSRPPRSIRTRSPPAPGHRPSWRAATTPWPRAVPMPEASTRSGLRPDACWCAPSAGTTTTPPSTTREEHRGGRPLSGHPLLHLPGSADGAGRVQRGALERRLLSRRGQPAGPETRPTFRESSSCTAASRTSSRRGSTNSSSRCSATVREGRWPARRPPQIRRPPRPR